MERLAVNCKAMCSELSISFWLPVTSNWSLVTFFHGSFSCKYLFPFLARSITSYSASLNLYCSKRFSIFVFVAAISSSNFLSVSSKISSCSFGTFPLQSLCINTKVRFTKFPKMATSSPFVLSWKSFQVKSLSFVSGALAHKT